MIHQRVTCRTEGRLRPLRYAVVVLAVGLPTVLLGPAAAHAMSSNTGFGFHAPQVAGAPTGSVFLTGGGAFNITTDFVHSAGGFRCTSDVRQGPLTGCLEGQGVRWDTASLLPSTGFTCTGEMEPVAHSGDATVVLSADFYRAGDGNDESFTAKMIVSADDFAPNAPGVQNVWVQGVGCGSAVVHFSS